MKAKHARLYRVSAVWLMLAGALVAADDAPSQASAIYRESSQPASGPAGRPLPLVAEYNTGTLTMMKPADYQHQWQPSYMMDLVEQGHHALVTFADPILMINRSNLDTQAWIDDYYGPTLKRCMELNQPIAFMDWNYAAYLYQKEPWRDLPPEENSLLITVDGKQHKKASPFGPLSVWHDLGLWMTAHPTLRRLQEIYPKPPRIIFISNNEGNRLSDWKEAAQSRRFVQQYGTGHDREFVEATLTTAWIAAWKALREGMREGLIAEAWKQNCRITGYNAYGPDHLGRWGGWRSHALYTETHGFGAEHFFEGSQVSWYDNDWEYGKTDYSVWSMQTEFMNLPFMLERTYRRAPDYWFELAVWHGSEPQSHGDTREGNRQSKPWSYIKDGQTWSPERFAGSTQFGMWLLRPRVVRQFTGYTVHREPVWQPFWMALVEAVDRVHRVPVLTEFWRHGELVPNTERQHPFRYAIPESLGDAERWFLLDCDLNPPVEAWTRSIGKREPVVPVWALALVKGEPGARSWLVCAHAPRGARQDATLTVPGYGDITVAVSRGGSFYLVDEQQREAQVLHWGGPAELSLELSTPSVAAGETVTLTPTAVCDPGQRFTSFTWAFGNGRTSTAATPDATSISYAEAGQYVVTLAGKLDTGETVATDAAIAVGQDRPDGLVYRLPMDGALGEPRLMEMSGEREIRYRWLPDAAAPATVHVLYEGKLVSEAGRGQVLELDGEAGRVVLRGTRALSPDARISHRTIRLDIKPAATGRQVLYAEGDHQNGLSLYLLDGAIHAGAWAREWGWDGAWLKADNIEAGRWHTITFSMQEVDAEAIGKEVGMPTMELGQEKAPRNKADELPDILTLEGADHALETNAAELPVRAENAPFRYVRLRLFIDGEEVDAGAGISLPRHKGNMILGGHEETRCHDRDLELKHRDHFFTMQDHFFFNGRLDNLELWNQGMPIE